MTASRAEETACWTAETDCSKRRRYFCPEKPSTPRASSSTRRAAAAPRLGRPDMKRAPSRWREPCRPGADGEGGEQRACEGKSGKASDRGVPGAGSQRREGVREGAGGEENRCFGWTDRDRIGTARHVEAERGERAPGKRSLERTTQNAAKEKGTPSRTPRGFLRGETAECTTHARLLRNGS